MVYIKKRPQCIKTFKQLFFCTDQYQIDIYFLKAVSVVFMTTSYVTCVTDTPVQMVRQGSQTWISVYMSQYPGFCQRNPAQPNQQTSLCVSVTRT